MSSNKTDELIAKRYFQGEVGNSVLINKLKKRFWHNLPLEETNNIMRKSNNINITGIEVDFSQLPADYNSSMHPEAVKYRRALARVSNAIEGVILTEADKAFMDSIQPGMPKEEFKKAVLDRLAERRKEK